MIVAPLFLSFVGDKRKESQTVIYFYTTTILFIHWNEGIQHHDTECLHLVEVKTLSCNHTQFSTTKMERKGDTNKKITKQEDNHNKSHTLTVPWYTLSPHCFKGIAQDTHNLHQRSKALEIIKFLQRCTDHVSTNYFKELHSLYTGVFLITNVHLKGSLLNYLNYQTSMGIGKIMWKKNWQWKRKLKEVR